MKKDRDTVIKLYKTNPAPIVDSSITDLLELLNANSYQKGGWVLHMLRQKIGDDNFWAGIRNYYHEYQNNNALSDDLKRIMEQVSGQDLGIFFNQWLHHSGMPVLKGAWNYNQGKKQVELQITQVQMEDAFDAPLEISFYGENGKLISTEIVSLKGKNQKIVVKMAQKPVRIELDPNTNLLFDGNLNN
jgi:aminopeptidase N